MRLSTLASCFVALIVIPLGLLWVAEIDASRPEKWLLVAIVVMFPVFVASRVAYRSGFEAGRRSVKEGRSA